MFSIPVAHVRVVVFKLRKSGVQINIRHKRDTQKSFKTIGKKFYKGIIELAEMDTDTLANISLDEIGRILGVNRIYGLNARQVIYVLKHAGMIKERLDLVSEKR